MFQTKGCSPRTLPFSSRSPPKLIKAFVIHRHQHTGKEWLYFSFITPPAEVRAAIFRYALPKAEGNPTEFLGPDTPVTAVIGQANAHLHSDFHSHYAFSYAGDTRLKVPSALRIARDTLFIKDGDYILHVHLDDPCPYGFTGPPSCSTCAYGFRRRPYYNFTSTNEFYPRQDGGIDDGGEGGTTKDEYADRSSWERYADFQCIEGCDVHIECAPTDRTKFISYDDRTGECICTCANKYINHTDRCGSCINPGMNYSDYCQSCLSPDWVFPSCVSVTMSQNTESATLKFTATASAATESSTLMPTPTTTHVVTSTETHPRTTTPSHTETASNIATASQTTSPSYSPMPATFNLTRPSGFEIPILSVLELARGGPEEDAAAAAAGESIASQKEDEGISPAEVVGGRYLELSINRDEFDPTVIADGMNPALYFLKEENLMALNEDGTENSTLRSLSTFLPMLSEFTSGSPARVKILKTSGSFVNGPTTIGIVFRPTDKYNFTGFDADAPEGSFWGLEEGQLERWRLTISKDVLVSKRNPTPNFVDFALRFDLPRRPISDKEPVIPEAVTTSTQVVAVTSVAVSGALVGATTSASLVSRSTLILQMSQCTFDLNEPLDWASSPTFAKFGPTAPYHVGGAVMNTIVGLAIAGLHALCALIYYKVINKECPTMSAAMASVHFPSYSYFYLLLFIQPTVMCATTVFFEVRDPVTLIFAGALIYILIIAITCHGCWKALAPSNFFCEFKPWKKTNKLKHFFVGAGRWADIRDEAVINEHGDNFDHWGMFYQDYNTRARCFVVADLAINAVAGFIEGVHPSPGNCQYFSIAICVVYALYLALMVVYRPYIAPIVAIMCFGVTILQAIAVAIIAAAPNDPEAVKAATFIVIISMWAIFVKTIFDIVMLFLERVLKVVKVFDGVRSLTSKKTFNQESIVAAYGGGDLDHEDALLAIDGADVDDDPLGLGGNIPGQGILLPPPVEMQPRGGGVDPNDNDDDDLALLTVAERQDSLSFSPVPPPPTRGPMDDDLDPRKTGKEQGRQEQEMQRWTEQVATDMALLSAPEQERRVEKLAGVEGNYNPLDMMSPGAVHSGGGSVVGGGSFAAPLSSMGGRSMKEEDVDADMLDLL